LLLFLLGFPLAYWLAHTRSRWRRWIESLVSLPLVLPPTVIGFYLLLAFSPGNPFGRWLHEVFGIQFVFSFAGLVVGSLVYSLPFMVQPLQAGLEGLPSQLVEASYMLGKSRWQTLTRVILPNIRPSLWSGAILTFAHTVGEFGVVLMIGGNIPGQTRVASIAIFEEVESLHYAQAHQYAAILVVLSFLLLLAFYSLNQQHRQWRNR
jgi:molybdate transport system permease protein